MKLKGIPFPVPTLFLNDKQDRLSTGTRELDGKNRVNENFSNLDISEGVRETLHNI